MIFDHLDLFRISDFDFRICKFISTWRALRLRGSPCGVLALVETIRLGRAVTPRGSPCGELALVETIQLGRAVTTRGETSLSRFRHSKSTGNFKYLCLIYTFPPDRYGAFVLVGETHRELW